MYYLIGLEVRKWAGPHSFWRFQGEFIFLPFPASRGHFCSLTSGPFLHLQSQQQSFLTLLSSVPTTRSSPLLCTVKFLFYGYIRLRFGPSCISQSNLSILDLYSDLQAHAYNVNNHRFQEHIQDTDALGGII